MNTVLIFSGRSAFDKENFRWQLLRVPEVSKIIKEAQTYLDQMLDTPKDIATFMMSDNSSYLSSNLWRDFASQLIQVGLYQRYNKQSPMPRFLIGDMSDISALNVILNQQSCSDMTKNFVDKLQARNKEAEQDNFLVGHRLETIKAYEYCNNEVKVIAENKEVLELLEEITQDYIVDQVISIGNTVDAKRNHPTPEISIMESVSMDPMLSWLWPFLAAV